MRKSRFNSGTVNTEEEEKWVKNLFQEYNGLIPRYTLEGKLLYELNCTPFKMYYVIMNLVNDNVMELVENSDGEYYLLNL